MEDNKIIEIIKNGGATLDGNYNDFKSNAGFMVSIKGQEVKVNKNDIQGIQREIEKKREFVENKKGLFIGLWVDNDVMFIDVSIHIVNYLKALEIARNNDQLAIFDLKNNNSIYLTYLKYYNLYKVIKNKDNKIIDYKLMKQYDTKKEIKEELKASCKTIDNIIYKSFRQYEKRKKDFQDLILISDKITLQELTAYKNKSQQRHLLKVLLLWCKICKVVC